MNVWETDLTFVPFLGEDLIVCLGYFDGVHRGHQSLIHQAKSWSKNVAVLTFDRNPKHSERQESLTPFFSKKRILESLGVNHIIIVRFSDKIQHTSPAAFIQFLIGLGTKHIVCGPDFRFGYQAQGNVNLLQTQIAFTTHCVSPLFAGEQKISTSRILTMLANGEIETVSTLLGRLYAVRGRVGRGLGEGKHLGYPTANIMFDEPFVLPKLGVYITLVKWDGKVFYALASLGYHPTIASLDKPTLEVFLINYTGNLYDANLEVAFLKYLRPEAKFPNKEALVNQMNQDFQQAMALQSSLPNTF